MAKNTVELNKLDLVDNEVDVRKLSLKDYKQLQFRMQVKTQEILNQIMMNGIESNIVLREIAKKSGVENIDKVIDDAFNPDIKA